MNTVYQYLGLSPDIIDNFALQANLVIDGQMQRELEKRTRELSRLSEQFAEGTEGIAPKESVDKVIAKVKRLSKKVGETDNEWSSIELRILSYNLIQICNDAAVFDYAFNLLDRNWRNIFFGGLLFYLLNNWLSLHQNQKDRVCSILKRKLEAYDGSINRYVTIKNHADLLEANGPLRLATLLIHQSKSVISAPTILGYQESALSFSYFSDVILHYFSRSETIDVALLEQVFACHQLDRTKKLVLAMMVEYAEKEGREPIQTRVSNFAQTILGDIALSSTWAPFPNASQEEIEKLRWAQSLVNRWNAKKAINTFFELCVQDPKRKTFWLKYTNYIDDFRIAGSKAVYTKLLADDRIKDVIYNYFIKTNSGTGRTSALVLYIKDKVFVEFSDSGAIYVYNHDHWKISSLKRNNKVASIEDLKAPYFDKLVDNYGEMGYEYVEDYYKIIDLTKFNNEGKMFHIGYWDERLHAWIKNKLGIDFRESNDSRVSQYSTVPQFEAEKPFAISKNIFEGRCRVEAYRDGFYLRVFEPSKLIRIADMNYPPNGSLWIKNDSEYNNHEMVYYNTYDKEVYLGFLSFWDFKPKEIHFYSISNDDNITVRTY